MKQEIIKLITSIAIIFSSFLLIDILVGYIGGKALKNLPDYGNEICKINYRLNRVKTDMIIVGSSRARYHYHSDILSDSINMLLGTNYSIYNSGIDGLFIDCNTCAVECILNRYKPKLIIFETNDREFKIDKSQKRLCRYEPFYQNNSIIKDYFTRMDWKENMKIHINMYRFNSKVVNIIGCFLRQSTPDNGYYPRYRTMYETIDLKKNKPSKSNHFFNSYSIDSFNKMVRLCDNLNIKLIIATSPRYKPKGNNELIRSICNKHNTPYIELFNIDFFNNHPELFYDNSHLNNDGATIYTQMFFEKLKPFLKGF